MDYDNELRERFYKILEKTGKSIATIAPDIGIGRVALSAFLKSRRRTYSPQLSKITAFVVLCENGNKDNSGTE